MKGLIFRLFSARAWRRFARGVGEWNPVTGSPEQRLPYVIALADQIHAAVRDKDGEAFADAVRALYLRDAVTARVILRECLQPPVDGAG
ncbi:hypothetical protein [Spirillospora sp. CA-128828]|uniref:hypothetical protein n=1 Tax=Spirillospora sp. CA-128828 TaxID=3240033 RepID=UPI003D8B23C0